MYLLTYETFTLNFWSYNEIVLFNDILLLFFKKLLISYLYIKSNSLNLKIDFYIFSDLESPNKQEGLNSFTPEQKELVKVLISRLLWEQKQRLDTEEQNAKIVEEMCKTITRLQSKLHYYEQLKNK